MRSTTTFICAAIVAGAAACAQGASTTIATFEDPSSGGGTPLFARNGAQLTGGWSGAGLLLRTPGVPAPDFNNATFTMTPLTVTTDFGPFASLSGGTIQFFDSASNPILTMSFTSASLSNMLSLGASDFLAQNVTFSGPIMTGIGTYSSEAFSFSFANPIIVDSTHYSVTSAFTSSADVVIPAPGAATLLGIGGLLAARRRR